MATTEQLAQAQAALHAVRTGTKAIEVKKADGSTVKFSQADKADLIAYISELKFELGLASSGRRFASKVGF